MRVFTLLFTATSLLLSASSFAQNSLHLTPLNHVGMSFRFSALKQKKTEISDETIQIMKDSGLRGLIFEARSKESPYEVAFFKIKAKVNALTSIVPSEVQTITCAEGNPTGAYFLKAGTIGFEVKGKDQELRFMDKNNRICYFHPGASFAENVKLIPGEAVLLIQPGYKRNP